MRISLLLITLLAISFTSKAQFGGETGMGNVWHYPGQVGLELGLKRSSIGWNYSISASQYLKSNSFIKGNLFYDNGNFQRVGIDSFGLNAIYFYSPYSIAQTVFFNIGGGLTGNYDMVKNFWPQTKKKFNYGAIGAIEVEAAVADYLMITTTGQQRFLKNDTYGRARFEIGFGVKYLIN